MIVLGNEWLLNGAEYLQAEDRKVSESNSRYDIISNSKAQ